jgi:DNA-binding IclR family transcriptional regulator
MERRSERRDLTSRDVFAQRLQREFREIPELCMTAAQASELFGAPQQVCERLLSAMVADGLLTLRRSDGCYVRRARSI